MASQSPVAALAAVKAASQVPCRGTHRCQRRATKGLCTLSCPWVRRRADVPGAGAFHGGLRVGWLAVTFRRRDGETVDGVRRLPSPRGVSRFWSPPGGR